MTARRLIILAVVALCIWAAISIVSRIIAGQAHASAPTMVVLARVAAISV